MAGDGFGNRGKYVHQKVELLHGGDADKPFITYTRNVIGRNRLIITKGLA